MRVLFDTDVLLDLLLDRRPHADAVARILSRVDKGDVAGYVCATSVTTIFYLAEKAAGRQKARQYVQAILSFLEVAPITRTVLEGAFSTDFKEYEDAVTHEAALQVRADSIATRNTKDYSHSRLPVYTPADLLAILDVSA